MSQLNNSAGAVAHGARGLLRGFAGLSAPRVLELILGLQHAVEGRFRGNVLPAVGQPGHDLTWRKMAEFGRVGNRQQALAFEHAQLIFGRLYPCRPAIAGTSSLIVLPALQGAFAQRNDLAGTRLACTCNDRLGHHGHHLLALWKGGHGASSSHSARNFFCRISNAAASASALSLRTNSRLSFTFSSFNVRTSRVPDDSCPPAQKAVCQLVR